MSTAKENILKKIRQALTQSVPVPFPQSEGTTNIYTPLQQEIEVELQRTLLNYRDVSRFVLITMTWYNSLVN